MLDEDCQRNLEPGRLLCIWRLAYLEMALQKSFLEVQCTTNEEIAENAICNKGRHSMCKLGAICNRNVFLEMRCATKASSAYALSREVQQEIVPESARCVRAGNC